jgi:tetratricopeptide (TPR) repeat protein
MAGLTESRILKAKIMRRRGKYQESLELLDHVESAITGESMARIDLPLEKSILFYMTGALKEAELLLLKALNSMERLNDGYLSAHLLEGLGNINYVKGNYQKALQFYKKGATTSPDRVLPSYYSQDFIATIYQDWGESEQAFEYAKRNVAIKENLGLIESLPSAYIQLAGIYVDRGQFDQAEKYYRRAVDLGRDNNSESFYLALNLVFWARCLCLQNRLIEAKLKLEEALVEAGSEPSIALAVCRSVGSMVLYRFGHTVEAEELLLQGIKDLERMGFQKGLCGAYETIAAL